MQARGTQTAALLWWCYVADSVKLMFCLHFASTEFKIEITLPAAAKRGLPPKMECRCQYRCFEEPDGAATSRKAAARQR